MMDINLKRLVEKLNDTTRRSLEGAAGLCLSRSNYNVEIEHWLAKLLETTDTDFARLLRHYEIDQSRVESSLTRAIDRLKTGNTRPPALSQSIVDLVREAWVFASVEFSSKKVRSGHLLLALLSVGELNRILTAGVPELAAIAPDALKRDMRDVTDGSVEDEAEIAAAYEEAPAGEAPKTGGKTPALDQYTVNLTLRAKQGLVDPVVGRDFEIRQLIDILMRRRQNNPILTGEAGVGKTAVVEGFAQRIADNDVPPPLRNVSLRTLDLGLLQAGAGVKGEFENRLKSVINEVKASPQPIILFIDEAHTMIGAGGTAGQGDAANLLKPALARGELRTVAATTWSEYKKYFEKDAALARRFQVVKVEEPEENQAVIMMRGIVKSLEKHHKLEILEEALEDAVRLSRRYITGRQLPDKAVSILDTAGARVAIGHAAVPPAVEDARREIDHLGVQIGILKRETEAGSDHSEQIAELNSRLEEVTGHLEKLEERWGVERDLVAQIRDIRTQLATGVKTADEPESAAEAEGSAGETDAETAAENPGPKEEKEPVKLSDQDKTKLKAELEKLNTELREVQGETPLMQVCVDSQTIAEVISGWTGIPVGKMLTDEIRMISTLKERMEERIVGQSHGLEAIARRIQTARANLVDPRKPIGVFMLVGPSGVGKTETALTLADIMYGGERNMVTINMSEYQEAHTVSGLKGSPPGYVGYGEGGVLTEAVRRKPYCVVLLDEIEKAHQDVIELFYQVFDKGLLEDAEGREIDFKNTVILLTSNVGTDTIQSLCADPETMPDAETLAQELRPDLLKAFPPAFLGRLNVVPYFALSDDVMQKIIVLQLNKIAARLKENHRAELVYDEAVVKQILDRCQETESGARNVDHILTGTLLPEISSQILARMGEEQPISRVEIAIDETGGFGYEVE